MSLPICCALWGVHIQRGGVGSSVRSEACGDKTSPWRSSPAGALAARQLMRVGLSRPAGVRRTHSMPAGPDSWCVSKPRLAKTDRWGRFVRSPARRMVMRDQAPWGPEKNRMASSRPRRLAHGLRTVSVQQGRPSKRMLPTSSARHAARHKSRMKACAVMGFAGAGFPHNAVNLVAAQIQAGHLPRPMRGRRRWAARTVNCGLEISGRHQRLRLGCEASFTHRQLVQMPKKHPVAMIAEPGSTVVHHATHMAEARAAD